MDSAQARINLEADLERIEDTATAGWVIKLFPTPQPGFFCTARSVVDAQTYVLRLDCDNYPDSPPSVRCVGDNTNEPMVARSWPICEGFRLPPQADICMNITREGFALHPDWVNDPVRRWSSQGNPIWLVLQALQDRLNDKAKYHGRAA